MSFQSKFLTLTFNHLGITDQVISKDNHRKKH